MAGWECPLKDLIEPNKSTMVSTEPTQGPCKHKLSFERIELSNYSEHCKCPTRGKLFAKRLSRSYTLKIEPRRSDIPECCSVHAVRTAVPLRHRCTPIRGMLATIFRTRQSYFVLCFTSFFGRQLGKRFRGVRPGGPCKRRKALRCASTSSRQGARDAPSAHVASPQKNC